MAIDELMRLSGEIRRLNVRLENMDVEAARRIAVTDEQQKAIVHRDALLTEMQETANRLQAQLATAQQDINYRDQLLDNERARFNATVEGRLLAGARQLVNLAHRFGIVKKR